MAYIIVHGTVGGWKKLWPKGLDTEEANVIQDIRDELDKAETCLKKPAGYLLHMAPHGVWFSIVRLLNDGGRSGKGKGFFAFSAFLPSNQIVEGKVVKHILDDVLDKYLSRLSKERYSQNIIDWSFVDIASEELNAQCKTRKRLPHIHYEKSKRFAYVNADTEEQVIRYLDKPFQSEYGQYQAVFLGTYLQDPSHLPLQTQLNIDLDNEEYEIIWNGNEADYPDCKFPLTIRKKQIDSKEIVLKKPYYKDKTIRFVEGERDDPSNTLTLNIPQLEPEEFTIKLQFAIPRVAQSVKATAINGHTIESKDNQTLKFKGEEVTKQYKVHVETNGDYYVEDFSFKPQDYLDKPYPIGVKKTKTIQLQIIDEKGGNVTGRFYSNILVNREKLSYNKGKQSLVTKIFEGDDFRNYSVKLTGNNNYDLDSKPFQQGEIFCVTIRKKKPIHRDPEPGTTLPYDDGDEEETFNLIEELKKGNFSILLLIVGVALIVCAIFFAISHNKVEEQVSQTEQEALTGETSETDTIKEQPTNEPKEEAEKKQIKEKKINDELTKILEEQEDKWNSRTLLKSIEGKYDSATLDNLSYQNKQCVKKISWLWHTRDLLNTKNWNKLNDYIDVNGDNYKRFDKYKAIDQGKLEFLRELILNDTQTANARAKFEKGMGKNFPKKSFSEIKKIWEKCKNTSDSPSPQAPEGDPNKMTEPEDL